MNSCYYECVFIIAHIFDTAEKKLHMLLDRLDSSDDVMTNSNDNQCDKKKELGHIAREIPNMTQS